MRRGQGIGLVLFCLLTGSEWLIEFVWPDALPPLLGQSLRLAFVGLLALAVSLVHDRGMPAFNTMGWVVTASLLLFVVPALLGQFAGAIRSETSVVLYTLVPLMVVLAVTFRGNEAARAGMAPALTGLAGALFLLSWQLPTNVAAALSFAGVLLAVLLTATASVWMHSLLEGQRLAGTVTAIAFTNAIVLGLAGFARGERVLIATGIGTEFLSALLFGLPQLLLLIWLLREIPPERNAARFLFVPLVTVAEGSFLLHTRPDLRTTAGMLLLLAASGWLAFGRDDTAPSLDLR